MLNSMKSIRAFSIYSNHLSGSLGTSVSQISYLLINDNHFTGPFFSLVTNKSIVIEDSTPYVFELINIANNLFTGSMTDDFFTMTNLIALFAGSNCLTGSIPETICSASSLNVLELNAVGSNRGCASNIHLDRQRPVTVHGTFSQLGLRGTIPSCLLTSKSLTNLLLAGISSALFTLIYISLQLIYVNLGNVVAYYVICVASMA